MTDRHDIASREGILNFLEDIPPSELFEQLFVSLVSLLPLSCFHFQYLIDKL